MPHHDLHNTLQYKLRMGPVRSYTAQFGAGVLDMRGQECSQPCAACAEAGHVADRTLEQEAVKLLFAEPFDVSNDHVLALSYTFASTVYQHACSVS